MAKTKTQKASRVKVKTETAVQPEVVEEPCLTCQEAPAPAPPAEVQQEVLVETIADGELFEYRGMTFKKTRRVYSGQVIASRVIGISTAVRATGTAEFLPGVKVMKK